MDDLARIQLRFLIRELERIEAQRSPTDDPRDITPTRLYGESLGVRSAIAHMTGVYGIRISLKGGPDVWLPLLKEALK